MQVWIVSCWVFLALVGAEECPDGRTCEDAQSCCNDPINGYECCPFTEAECCDDHTHCCPAGMTCDSAKSSCVNATASISWVERANVDISTFSKSFRMIKSYMGEGDDNICPDQSRCPAEFSCLRALTRFGCCPLAQGLPCLDGQHCCPEGHRCSADSRSCIRHELVTTVSCSDGLSECPDQTTCSETPEGKWGCCPMPQAVSCADKLHCCPEGTACDIPNSKCIFLSTKKEAPMWAKLPARIRAQWENKKDAEQATAVEDRGGASEKSPKVTLTSSSEQEEPVPSVHLEAKGDHYVPCNETVICPNSFTCCRTKDVGWTCCPLVEAVCCEDMIHCCPKGTRCNHTANTCDDDQRSEPMVEKTPVLLRLDVHVELVPCDSSRSCPDGNTCCKTSEGGWACCPLPEAVCCEDFIHCCPQGTTCNLQAETCDEDGGSVPWVQKVPALVQNSVKVELVPCDSSSSCPDENTCCKTSEGGWACCPLPEAVCCEDFIHCCPQGTKCNMEAETCDEDGGSVPWVQKVPALVQNSVKVELVPCDSSSSCPDENTCCKTSEGGWACCPLPEAVCCEDFIHCCPQGTTCNLQAETCDEDGGSVSWVQKVPALVQNPVKVELVPCDSSSSCPDGNTCCKTSEGGWACCPLPEAVCCEDFIHCCPQGTTCNLQAETCDEDGGSVPWVQKVPALVQNSVKVELVPCDSSSSCPDGNTCCKTSEGGWACCPLPEAVCCGDFIHCCPQGTTCNLQAETCDEDERSVPWVQKVPALVQNSVKVELVPCDSSSSCPDGNTCCKTSEGGWACCPLPEAVCCEDFIHCCPQGTKCNMEAETCDEDGGSVPWVQKVPALVQNSVKVELVPCDSSSSCPDGNTCCKTSEGGWACCPLPEAVCCDDHEHCCPKDTTCDLSSLTCNGASGSTSMKQKEPALVTPSPTTAATMTPMETEEGEEKARSQCDAYTSCPSHTTCCFMAKYKKWGCCPLPEAVCCSDGCFCCPANYHCDEGRTSCVKGDVVIPWYPKLPATTTYPITTTTGGPADGVKCPDQTTSCQHFTGEWACCLLQNAVCCPDQQHCCPEGYHCNIDSQSCEKVIMLQLERLPLTPFFLPEHASRSSPPESRVIHCDDQTVCKDTDTCCLTSAHTWGCCPSPNAVCCSDMAHCCPSGYTCTSTGSCVKNSRLLWQDWDLFQSNKKRDLIV